MWSKTVEILLKILSVIVPSLLSYEAGKRSIESKEKDKVISDAQKRIDIENEIAASYSDPDKRKRLRDENSE